MHSDDFWRLQIASEAPKALSREYLQSLCPKCGYPWEPSDKERYVYVHHDASDSWDQICRLQHLKIIWRVSKCSCSFTLKPLTSGRQAKMSTAGR